ncbi:neck protein [Vibrio phage phiKT1024]|nr:neck protein [Vibrio phage phiKT1024]
MARINTKVGLTNYIKSQLGAPTINVEVTDDQIGEIIDDAVQKFTEYAYGTLEGAVIVELSGMGEYDMPDTMTNLIKLSKGGTSNLTNFQANFGEGYVPNIWSEQFFTGTLTGSIIPSIISISATTASLQKFLGDDIVFNFNPYNKKLQVLENYSGPCVLHYQYEYLADDNGDLIFNHEWIKNYTKAKTKELWSTVTGKYDQALVGGARINYDKMAQEAERDIEKLDEELLNKFSDPAPIDIA